MLRNCNYELAGTVIKQQYYDDHKQTEINRLIDRFMADPGFDEALNLIAYNEMMIFYFTESCEDGLYVRQSTKETEEAHHHSADKSSPHTRDDDTQEPSDTPAPAFQSDTDKAAEPNGSFPNESAETASRRKQIEESEEWMNEMIARSKRKAKPFDASARENYPAARIVKSVLGQSFHAHIDYGDPPGEQHPAAEQQAEEAPEAPTAYIERIEYINDAQHEPEAAAQALPDDDFAFDAAPQVPGSSSAPETAAYAQLGHRSASEAAAASEHAGQADAAVRPSFANVVTTLNMDIHTMMKQLSDYRRQLAEHPPDEERIRIYIRSLEKAIDEFSLAVDLLEGERR